MTDRSGNRFAIARVVLLVVGLVAQRDSVQLKLRLSLVLGARNSRLLLGVRNILGQGEPELR